MVGIELRGSSELIRKLAEVQARANGNLKKATNSAAILVEVAAKKASKPPHPFGGPSPPRTSSGELASSIRRDPTAPALEVAIGTNVKYGPIHDYGGKTKPHEIRPRFAMALRFPTAASIKTHKATRFAFAKVVHHPGSTFRAHHWLSGAFDSVLTKIRAEYEQALQRMISS